MDARKIANGLGLFSIGLGVLETARPGAVTQYFGLVQKQKLVRTYGVREIASGAAILGSKNPAPALWSRVVGDVVDIGTLSTGLTPKNPKRNRAMVGIAAVAMLAVLDVLAAKKLGEH